MLVATSALLFIGAAHALCTLPSLYPDLKQCADVPLQYSCENTTAFTNSCCNIVEGGLVLQTQFWSTYTGLEQFGQMLPQGSWTIHGLWPDNCNGTWSEYCDASRIYNGSSVRAFIQDFGRWELLKYMDTYWINQGAPNDNFWAHEFSKHATCTSTFDVACYGPDYVEHQDVVNFFETVVKVFQMYPTYNMLAAFGILPSNTTTYTLAEITDALVSQIGAVPYLGCYNNGTVLSEVYYYNHVLGTEQYGTFKPINSSETSNCNADGIWYYEPTPTSLRQVA